MKQNIFEQLRTYLKKEVESHGLLEEKVKVRGAVLSSEEAIGRPTRQDFPLQKGKERLVQAEFKGCLGQAFTDEPHGFEGILQEFVRLSLNNNHERACFIAVLNAVMLYLGKIEKTIHCKDDEPNLCAQNLVEYLKEHYRDPKIGIVGFQPALIEYCSKSFPVRVLDLNPDNVGKVKYGVKIEEGEKAAGEVIKWCNLLLVTGSTLANGTIVDFLQLDKPVIFYGTTIAAAAEVLGLQRFCFCAKN